MWNYKVSKINNDKLGKITWLNNFCLTEKAACLKTACYVASWAVGKLHKPFSSFCIRCEVKLI